MEFWGVEVKHGEPIKVQPELGKLIHISQAALGEVKDVKGAKHVPLRLKIDTKNYVIGALSAEDRTQLMFDLVFERDFELSHDWKNGSVYFIGYTADDPVSDEENLLDESEGEPVDNLENGKIMPKVKDVKPAKNNAAAAKTGTKKVEESEFDEEDDESESDSDDGMEFGGSQEEDSSDVSADIDSEEDMNGSFSSEEESPKVEQPKKRPAKFALGTPVPSKKAKSSTPDKTGNKNGHIATPYPTKKGGRTPSGSKSNEQKPKSGGQLSCNSCSKSFTSQNALQSHSKFKHGDK